MYKRYLEHCQSEQAGSQDLARLGGGLPHIQQKAGRTATTVMNYGSRESSEEEDIENLPENRLSPVARSNARINSSENGKHRKLILHFDIRNTVLVADSVTNVSVEQALNSFLTGVTWGKEDTNGEWRWHSDKLSLTPPTGDTMTFYKYLEGKYVQTTNDRTMLRLATGDFTHSGIGEIFHAHFKNHMELLRWRHPYNPESHSTLTMAGQDEQPYNYIVPSVYKCIHHLVDSGRDFAIVFRTYGLDAPNVIRSLEHGLSGNHPGFRKTVNLKINKNIGLVKRSDKSNILFEEFDAADETKSTVFQTDRDIYQMLCQKSGISGFRDDIQYWLHNSYNHSTAKPLFVDPFDCNVQHIFFDDNIRTYEDDSIVDLRMFDSRDAKMTRSLTKSEAGKFDNMCMVQADLIKSIENEDYYLEKVKECELNYSHFLRRFSKFARCISVQHV